jgi:hypothetical protein
MTTCIPSKRFLLMCVKNFKQGHILDELEARRRPCIMERSNTNVNNMKVDINLETAF